MKIILIALFFLSPSLYANNIVNEVEELQVTILNAGKPLEGGCHDCRVDKALTRTPLPIGKNNFNKRCESFIKADGSYGDWGKLIVKYMNKTPERQDRFFSPAIPGMQSIPRSCPNWGNINNEEKSQFWVWIFASIAQVESSCDNRAVNTGKVPNPNDRPRGLFQLNTLRKNRSWRGANCKFPTGAESVYIPANSIHCSLDIMAEILKGRSGEYKSNGKIFPTNSYWEKLRPNHSSTGGAIGKLVRKYPLCQKN